MGITGCRYLIRCIRCDRSRVSLSDHRQCDLANENAYFSNRSLYSFLYFLFSRVRPSKNTLFGFSHQIGYGIPRNLFDSIDSDGIPTQVHISSCTINLGVPGDFPNRARDRGDWDPSSYDDCYAPLPISRVLPFILWLTEY